MAKHKISMSDYDDSKDTGGYTGEEPRRGVYEGKMIHVKDHTSANGNDGFEWCFEITKGEFKGWRGYTYSNLETAMWKTRQIINAIFGKKDVTLDTDEDGAKMVKKARPVSLRIKSEMYEGEKKGRLNAVLPLVDADDDDDDDDDDPFE